MQPVTEIAALARDRGAISHSDAVQAVGHLPVDFAASGLDLMTFTAHKLGGPYGIGALLARREIVLTAVQHGGRSGARRPVRHPRRRRGRRFRRRGRRGLRPAGDRDGAAAGASRAVGGRGPGALCPTPGVQGSLDPAESLPGVVNLGFPGCSADAILMLLDAAGIDCSTGSACSAGVSQPSHVLIAMGYTEAEARSSLRFSLGHTSTASRHRQPGRRPAGGGRSGPPGCSLRLIRLGVENWAAVVRTEGNPR